MKTIMKRMAKRKHGLRAALLICALFCFCGAMAFPSKAEAKDSYKEITYKEDCDGGNYKAKLNLTKKTAQIISCPNDSDVRLGYYIPYKKKDYKVTSVKSDALKNCKKTTWISFSAPVKTYNMNLKYCKNLENFEVLVDTITTVKKDSVKGIAKKCEIMCFNSKQQELFKNAIPKSRNVKWLTTFDKAEK